jgi:hypothetical protein
VEYIGKERESQLSYLEGKLTLGQRREEFPEPLVAFPILPYMRFSFIGTQNTKPPRSYIKPLEATYRHLLETLFHDSLQKAGVIDCFKSF